MTPVIDPPQPQPPEIRMAGRLEPRSAWRADNCPIAKSLEVVSTRSAFLILREAFYGATRFEQFVAQAEVSEPVAATRLRELVQAGLLAREPYQEPGQRTRQEYHLTEMGADLLPTLVALMEWGNRWVLDDGGRVELRHAGCGEHVGVELSCAGGHTVGADQLQLQLRKGRHMTLSADA
jgi:DNA-binding HxlR family transcriptional regulator